MLLVSIIYISQRNSAIKYMYKAIINMKQNNVGLEFDVFFPGQDVSQQCCGLSIQVHARIGDAKCAKELTFLCQVSQNASGNKVII